MNGRDPVSPRDPGAFRGVTDADLLVTGTDTGVGKTVVAAALIFALRQKGVKAVGFKPVETGLVPGVPADSEVLAVASSTDLALARPLKQLPEPLAPAVAAERTGTALDPWAVEDRVRGLRAAGHRVLVEGAGGLLVPLAWGFSAADLALRLGLSAVVVARAGLGTLNHVLLTVEALQRRNVAVRGIVLNGRNEPPDLAESTNPGVLERLLPGFPIVVVPRHPTSTPLAVARGIVGHVAKLV
jgi:dethiobiotin synthetase